MKKMKCDSCGANLEVSENSDYATCPYCKVKYKIGDSKNINININDNSKDAINNGINSAKKVSIIAILAFVLVPILIFGGIVFIAISAFNTSKSTGFKGIKDIINIEEDQQFEINSFNNDFESYSGTSSKFFISDLLDKVVTNNKKNKDKLITVTYNDKTTTNPDEIISIKQSLSGDYNVEYEVKLDYDDKGYVNRITLLDI